MKKFISILLVLIVCLSFFSACEKTPPPTPEEIEQNEIKAFCEKVNDIHTNGKNYREYIVDENINNHLFYVKYIDDVSQDKVRSFMYSGKTHTVGFGDTVDENGTRCFSSIQAILDMGLFSVKVEDSFAIRHIYDTSRYSYTWGTNSQIINQPSNYAEFPEYYDVFEFSETTLITKADVIKGSDEQGYIITTHIGKVPDFDTSEIGYVETSNPKNYKENIEKVTIIPDPNLGK